MAAQCLFVNHPELYFEDGNIVLSASCTLDKEKWGNNNLLSSLARGGLSAADADHLGFRFRVHKSILASSSKTFKEKFERLRTCEADGTHDGVPLICIPHRAETVDYVIAILYGKPYNITSFIKT